MSDNQPFEQNKTGCAREASQDEAPREYDPSTDILYGARACAKWLFNDDSDRGRKRIFYLNSIRSGVPFFKTGNTICLSKAAYTAWAAGKKK